MANTRGPVCRSLSVCLALILIVIWGCSRTRQNTAANQVACNALTQTLNQEELAFIDRAKTIRAEHVLLRDYDREMIAAIIERRKALQATKLIELSVNEEIAGCSGAQLDDLRYRAQAEMANLRDFLNDFNRALRSDPSGVFLDEQ